MNLTLTVLVERFTVHRCSPHSSIPTAVLTASPAFIGRTADELSIVCEEGIQVDSERAEGPWRCFKVEGPLDFGLTGIMAGLSTALSDTNISLFAVSTFDTDYVLVASNMLQEAQSALSASGCTIRRA